MTEVTSQDIAGILGDTSWDTNNLTFSFPTAASNYGDGYGAEDGFGGNGEPYSGFQPLTPEQQDVVRHDLNLISQYTLLTFTEVTETDDSGAVLRFAESGVPDPATYYSPSQFFGGDVWLGSTGFDDPAKGSHSYNTILMLIGGAIGLKSGSDPEPFGLLPPQHDSLEWSVMSSSTYVGADPRFYLATNGNGDQTYMINDIAALQYLYGANFSTNAGNTVYSWSPTTGETFIDGVGQGASTTNKIFASIWDGGGIDTFNLSNYSTDLFINLAPGEWSTFSRDQLAELNGFEHNQVAPGNIANPYLYNDDPRSLIENVIGGSGYDLIAGNQANNMLAGGAGDDLLGGMEGNDRLVGGVGNDWLFGGAGNDVLDGGAGGSDTAGYLDAHTGVVVNLAHQGAPQNTGGGGIDTLSNIENVSGSDFNDTLTGDGAANYVEGGAGNDNLAGGAGNDTMVGDADDDTVNGGLGNDLMDGGVAGSDTASYADAGSAVTVSLAHQGSAQNTVGAGSDTFTNFENLTGSAFNDSLSGDASANILNGGAGNDSLAGAVGNDTLTGLAGNDTLTGGIGNDSMDGGAAGSDTASYADATTGVTVSLAISAAQNTIGAGVDTLVNFENLTGSNFNDTLTGNGVANILNGGAGNDMLNAGVGNDSLVGGIGNDLLIGGAGNDSLDGGAAGSDTASYTDATAGVTVSLATTVAQNTIGSGVDRLVNIENLTGSNLSDSLTGNAAANILSGGVGNDTLWGSAGNDSLIGAAGNDTLVGGVGNDSMDGGAAGSDTASYADATAGVKVSLAITAAQNTIGAGVDTLLNFENLTGSSFNDTLTGDTAANILNGGAGIDILSGGAGNDRLIGGAGNDSLDGGTGTDSFVFDKAFGKDTITGFVATGTGHDTIDFSTSAFASFASIKSHMFQSGANVVIRLDHADSITLKNVTLASLTAADFTFHAGAAPAAPAQPAASPSLDPDGSHADLGGGIASITSGHAWLDHGVQANSFTMFG